MNTPAVRFCNRIIEYTFYAIFFFVPLVLTSNTSELFEFNKLWLTFILTIIIVATWISKMLLQKRMSIMKTPLDIPILLFLSSQIVSTIFSLDTHVSLWGYYSRFNGGLLSILSYVLLYYAFVSNFFDKEEKETIIPSYLTKQQKHAFLKQQLQGKNSNNGTKVVKRLLLVSLFSGFVVALWGFPSHFGYDPTCWMFRKTLDVSCWTDQFRPTIRMFSTLGQPGWLAAFLSILLPITIALAIKSQLSNDKSQITTDLQKQNSQQTNIWNLENWNLFGFWSLQFGIFFLLAALFYIDLTYTDARSGFLGFWIGFAVFSLLLVFISQKNKLLLRCLLIFLGLFLLLSFFLGTPITQIDRFTLPLIREKMAEKKLAPAPRAPSPVNSVQIITPEQNSLQQTNITDSGKIRLIVWKGALDIWKHNLLFGSGVETYAFAYYQYRPIEHNLTSEWDYLYNKAHNEYLNFLSTTGAFGLGTYLLLIGYFLFSVLRFLMRKTLSDKEKKLLIIALVAGYISILISNFFGFSVVIVNLFFFLIPAFVYILIPALNKKTLFMIPKEQKLQQPQTVSGWAFAGITILWLIGLYYIFSLYQYWRADQAYYMGSNLNRAGHYQEAYPYLREAIMLRGDEPVFKDEISISSAVLAVAFAQAKDASKAAEFAQEAITISNQVVAKHPNNVLFWKSRTRVLYSLSQLNNQYLPLALQAITQAHSLAPTDAKVLYNLGLLYGQNGDSKKAVEILERTVKLKPNYRDAYYALGLFSHELSLDKNGKVVNEAAQKKAIETMRYILDHLNKDDTQAKDALKTWGAP